MIAQTDIEAGGLRHAYFEDKSDMIQLLLCLALVFAVCICFIASCGALSAVERSALVDLYFATNGAHWTLGWDVNNPNSDPCSSWSGVYCSSNSVYSISLYQNNLSGTLPDAIGNLTSMKSLTLPFNRISGTLPKAWSSLVNLQYLRLDNNLLTGTLPEEYALWQESILTFSARNNRFNGTLPVAYSSWRSLLYFLLEATDIRGTLPRAYMTWTSLVMFCVSNSQLTGSIPEEWAAMRQLRSLELYLNRLSGPIPSWIGNLKNVFVVNFASNNFSGVVPFEAWSKLRNVSGIVFQDNPLLSGVVPLSWNAIVAPFGTSVGPQNSVVSIVDICRTSICGPYLPALGFGYVCVPTASLSMFGLNGANGSMSASFEQFLAVWSTNVSVSCDRPPPLPTPPPTRTTNTATREYHPDGPNFVSRRTRTMAAAATSVSIGVAVQALIPGVAAVGGGSARGMQAALVVQQLRRLCTAARIETDFLELSNQGLSVSSNDKVDAYAEDVCCDSATSPTLLRVSIGKINSLLPGAAIGNFAIVAGFGIFRLFCHLLTELGQRSVSHKKTTAPPCVRHIIGSLAALFDSSHVALFWAPYCLLLTPTIGVAIPLLAALDSTPGTITLGVFVIFLWFVPWGVSIHRIVYRRGNVVWERTHHVYIKNKRTSLSTFEMLRRFLLQATEELLLSPPSNAAKLLRGFGPVFSGYRATRVWYFNVELTISVTTGILIGLSFTLRDVCAVNVIGWLLVAVGMIECLAACVFLPFSTPIDFLSLFVVCGFSVASQIISLVSDSDDGQAASQILGMLASFLQLGLTVFLSVEVVASSGGAKLFRSVSIREQEKQQQPTKAHKNNENCTETHGRRTLSDSCKDGRQRGTVPRKRTVAGLYVPHVFLNAAREPVWREPPENEVTRLKTRADSLLLLIDVICRSKQSVDR
ncbi:GP46-like surface antigen, putative [Bodo saltans]|uniref:GP46-like surface antigen, putative n=1 Tax=Bodo saltans TaxID=75058 RepID=A0A0S4KP55_BODSA|nr:GP46-like surface antigen, putative [Bodo saltans]|eukprot:CUI14689.1 GP46-like surface antigen, putative [Bodo saltans]